MSSADSPANGQLETVADRLAKLERALANLQDQNQLEQRITEQLMTKLQVQLPALPPGGGVPGLAANSLLQGVMTAAATASVDAKASGSFWDWMSLLREVKLIARMYFDPRYRLSRIAQLGVPIILVMMVLNYLNFTYVWVLPIASQILERVIFLILVLVLYRILSREAQRYDEVLKYLARFGQ